MILGVRARSLGAPSDFAINFNHTYKHYFKFCQDVFRIPFTFSLGFGFSFSYFCALFTHKLETRNAKQKMPLMMMLLPLLLLLLLSLLLSWKFSLRFGRHYEPRSALSRPARTPVHTVDRHPSNTTYSGLFFETETTTKTKTNRSDRLVDSLARALCGFVYLWLNVVCDWKPKPKTETKSLRTAETEAGCDWERAPGTQRRS